MSDDPRRDPRAVQPDLPRHGRFYQYPTSRPEQSYPQPPPPAGQNPPPESPYQQSDWGQPQRPQMMTLPPPSGPLPSVYRRNHSLSLDSSTSRPPVPGFRESQAQVESPNSSASIPRSYSPPLSSQKRAFRQRRKDPSCDACRERKVKCDATDTMSCSECASRQVKCQFTKETNRRMSSMKQLQDLERQLTQANQQNARLKSMLKGGSTPMDVDPSGNVSVFQGNPLASGASSEARPDRSSKYDQARRNIRTHSNGIFKPPPAFRIPRQGKESARIIPSLPPKQLADSLILICHDTFCQYSPVLHWPTFLEEYETTYKSGSLNHAPNSWIALLFAMFAIGTLPRQKPSSPGQTSTDGFGFAQEATQQLQGWTEEPNIDHCRASLMISTYFLEMNMRSASWTWITLAIAFATDLGLDDEGGTWPLIEAETRRRVWWAIYYWERSLVLELSRPTLINDEDCRVTMPDPSQGLPTHAQSVLPAAYGQYIPSPLEVVMPIARLVDPLRKAMKSKPIAITTLEDFDMAFESIASSMPEPLQPHSTSYLDPNMFRITTSIANVKIILHRLNLTPLCSAEERSAALTSCVLAAQSTARLVTRSLQPPPTTSQPFTDFSRTNLTWEARVRSSTPSTLCTHLWRCILVLSLALDFTSALSCVRVSTAIGDLRKINIACGRNLLFFLERLTDRMKHGQGTKQFLEQDEEMLAYASGDLQEDMQTAWVWSDSSTPMHEEGRFFSTSPHMHARPASTFSAHDPADGAVWPRVEAELMALRHEQLRQKPLPEFIHKRSTSATSVVSASEATGSATPTASMFSPGNERMNIANII